MEFSVAIQTSFALKREGIKVKREDIKIKRVGITVNFHLSHLVDIARQLIFADEQIT